MKFLNCMKHAANLRLVDGTDFCLEPSGVIATCSELKQDCGLVQTPFGQMLTAPKIVHGELVGLPEPVEGTFLYVGMLVFNAAVAMGRKDVVMGDSGTSAIRNDKGHIAFITTLIFA